MQAMRVLLSGMLAQIANNPIGMKSIQTLFRKELNHDGIPLNFSFTVYPEQSRVKAGSVSANLGLSTNSPVVVADFENSTAYLLRLNLPNIAVSAALLLLTSGCLWYMASVIRQQGRLQRLQTTFISNMAHEFRTPVAVLRSTHEALNQFGGLHDHEKALRYLKANQLVLGKLENDIDRMLTIVPSERGVAPVNRQEINLPNLLKEVIARYEHQGPVLQLDYNRHETMVFTDRFMLDSIVSNLVDNALKYGGEQVQVILSVTDTANGWQIDVKDNGPGIAQQHLPYLFDRFFRVPQGDLHDTKGYGLGLSFVKELTGRLQGKVAVTSIPEKGSIFSIQFPLVWKK
jgi:signal transduction histidine kinase